MNEWLNEWNGVGWLDVIVNFWRECSKNWGYIHWYYVITKTPLNIFTDKSILRRVISWDFVGLHRSIHFLLSSLFILLLLLVSCVQHFLSHLVKLHNLLNEWMDGNYSQQSKIKQQLKTKLKETNHRNTYVSTRTRMKMNQERVKWEWDQNLIGLDKKEWKRTYTYLTWTDLSKEFHPIPIW
jgi:hypothetical protein